MPDPVHDRPFPELGLLRGWWPRCLLVAVTLLAFHGSILSGFVSDDYYLVDRVSGEGFFTSWGGPGGDLFLRPGAVLSLMADRAVWGTNPEGFHATNLLLHILSSLLVMALAYRAFRAAGLGRPDLFAFLAACLFAVLPSHSESVCWVSGRTDLLATAFGLAATILYMRGGTLPALLLYSAGLLCKESILLLPLAWIFIPRAGGRGRNLPVILLLILAPVVYFTFRSFTSPGFLEGLASGGQLASPGWSPGENLFRAAVRTLLPPLPSSLEAAMAQFPPVLAIVPLLVLLVPVVIVLVRRRPSRAVVTALAVLLACWLLALAPALRIRVALFDTQSERLLYFPGVAFLLLSILLLVSLAGEGRLATGVLLAAIAAGCVSSIHISRNWSDAGRLCDVIAEDLCGFDPESTVIVNVPDNLNGAYVFRNGLDEAVRMHGGETGFRLLSTHTVSSALDNVAVESRRGMTTVVLPAGERFCSMNGIPVDSPVDVVTLTISGFEERLLVFSGGGMTEPPGAP